LAFSQQLNRKHCWFSARQVFCFQNIFYLAERTQFQFPQRRGLSGTLPEIAPVVPEHLSAVQIIH
jgi:hypothetical protein